MAQAAGQGNTGAYSTGSVFGADADAIRQQIEDQARQQDVALATAPNLNMGVVLGSQAGRGLGNFVAGATGYVDPRIREAKAMEDAAKEVDSAGFSLMKDPDAYYNAAYTALSKRGLYEQAGKVHDIMVQQNAAKQAAQTAQTVAQAKLNTSQAELNNSGKVYTFSPDGSAILNEKTGIATKSGMSAPAKDAVGKAIQDYNNGVYGDVGSAEAKARLDARIAKLNSDPMATALVQVASAVTGQGQTFLDAVTREKTAEQLAKDNSVTQSDAFKEGVGAIQAQQSLDSMTTLLDNSSIQFGAQAEGRAQVAKTLEQWAPGLAPDVNRALGMEDVSSFDAVIAAQENTVLGITNSMAGTAGKRLPIAQLDVIKRAAPAMFNDNTGMRIIAGMLQKNNQFKIDYADYISGLKDTDNKASLGFKWMKDNITSEKYNITTGDLAKIKTFENRAAVLRKYAKTAEPLPIWNDNGTEKANASLLQPGKIYFGKDNHVYQWKNSGSASSPKYQLVQLDK